MENREELEGVVELFVDRLNDLLKVDPVALHLILLTTHLCNEKFANHKYVISKKCVNLDVCSALGLINGLFGGCEYRILAVTDDDDVVSSFVVCKVDTEPETGDLRIKQTEKIENHE
jgi:hypothetical protein